MSSLSEQVVLMKQSLEDVEKELKSLESGRKASAPRARKSLQALKQSSHQLRKQITESVKQMPTKKRVKKEEVLPMEEIKQLQAEPEEEPEPEQEEKPKADASKKKARTKRVKKVVEK